MIESYINIFKQAPQDIEEYFNFIFKNFTSKCTFNEISAVINKPGNSLFHQANNIEDIFYTGKLKEFIAIFYYYHKLDWSFVGDIEKVNQYKEFQKVNAIFLIKNLNLEIDKILCNDEKESILMFLFLYFMPNIDKQDLLLLPRFKSHILSSPEITINNFNYLIYLLKDDNLFKALCIKENINIKLVENLIEMNTDLVSYSHINWYDFLPLDKINILLKYGFSLRSFDKYQSSKTKILAPNLFYILQEIEAKMKKSKLESLLVKKEGFLQVIKL